MRSLSQQGMTLIVARHCSVWSSHDSWDDDRNLATRVDLNGWAAIP